jgi:transmembrane sensor
MQKNESHIDHRLEERLKALPDLDVEYKKSGDEVWTQLSRSIEASEGGYAAPVVMFSHRRVWMAAAVIFVLFGSTLFMRLYTTGVSVPFGQHNVAELPDGSTVELNAGSEISYKPLWWYVNREVTLEGEAFFEVESGKQFAVVSSAGLTMVLGTSFNVYARNNDYQVTCYTGKVRVVSSGSGHSLDILPREQATLNRDGLLRLSKVKNIEEPVSWKSEMFIFTAKPLNYVFEEIERQYAITIYAGENFDYLYTGNFSRNQSVEQALKMVCRPYGLQFRKTNEGYFIIND